MKKITCALIAREKSQLLTQHFALTVMADF
jgi:hypothetical protein